LYNFPSIVKETTLAPHRTLGIAPFPTWIDYASSTNSNNNKVVGLDIFIGAVKNEETKAEANVDVEAK